MHAAGTDELDIIIPDLNNTGNTTPQNSSHVVLDISVNVLVNLSASGPASYDVNKTNTPSGAPFYGRGGQLGDLARVLENISLVQQMRVSALQRSLFPSSITYDAAMSYDTLVRGCGRYLINRHTCIMNV